MTLRTATSGDQFRLSQLIYDQRYRAYTIQFFAFVAFFAVIGWLPF